MRGDYDPSLRSPCRGVYSESRQANFSLVKMVMPIAGNDGPMGPGPLGPWALAHWPMGPGPLAHGPWPIGPMGPGPLAHGPLPIGPWALAHGPWPIGPMGPGPLGPGPLGPPGDQKYRFFKKSGNGFPWCGNVGVPRGSVFKLSRASQLPYSEKYK